MPFNYVNIFVKAGCVSAMIKKQTLHGNLFETGNANSSVDFESQFCVIQNVKYLTGVCMSLVSDRAYLRMK